jgi:hypothetical protein
MCWFSCHRFVREKNNVFLLSKSNTKDKCFIFHSGRFIVILILYRRTPLIPIYIYIYHIFSGKYSSFEYLIKCQMPTLYRTPTLYTLLFKYMIKCIKHGKLRIICRITLDLKALWMILVSQDDTAYDTDFDMYYSLFITCIYEYYLI